MKFLYRLAHAAGFTPWERVWSHPPAVRQIARLLAREAGSEAPPLGRALELGCGRGHGSIVLAESGWQVTGIDLCERALRAARRAALEAEVEVDFVRADLEQPGAFDLAAPGLGDGFRLYWDFGVLHGMRQEARAALARELTARAAPAASALLFAWSPGRRGPLPRGMSQEEIEAAFPDWVVTDVESFASAGLPRPFLAVDPRVYRLRRSCAG